MSDFKTIDEFNEWYEGERHTGFCFDKQEEMDKAYLLYSTGWLAGSEYASKSEDDKSCALYVDYRKSCTALKERNKELGGEGKA